MSCPMQGETRQSQGSEAYQYLHSIVSELSMAEKTLNGYCRGDGGEMDEEGTMRAKETKSSADCRPELRPLF